MKPDADYDKVIFQACPNYSKGLEITASKIPRNARNIVSLGTGTGNLEALAFKKNPEARIKGYDWNKEWLSKAKEKLQGRRFTGVHADITRISISPVDCVISSLTLHHINNEDKKKLFREIAKALPSGGVFVNYDIVKARTEKEHNDFVEYITNHMKRQGFPEEFIEEERKILNGIGEGADTPMLLEEQKKILEKLGFEFKIKWRDKLFVVYECRKI